MKTCQSFFAASLFAALIAGTGCGGTSDIVDDGKAVSELRMSPDTTTLTKGAMLQFHAVVLYSDGTSKDVTESSDTVWNTSNPRIATVSDDGMVTGISEGLVDISASYKGEKANEHFAVTP
jgi:uncharacterized protein YjdB